MLIMLSSLIDCWDYFWTLSDFCRSCLSDASTAFFISESSSIIIRSVFLYEKKQFSRNDAVILQSLTLSWLFWMTFIKSEERQWVIQNHLWLCSSVKFDFISEWEVQADHQISQFLSWKFNWLLSVKLLKIFEVNISED